MSRPGKIKFEGLEMTNHNTKSISTVQFQMVWKEPKTSRNNVEIDENHIAPHLRFHCTDWPNILYAKLTQLYDTAIKIS